MIYNSFNKMVLIYQDEYGCHGNYIYKDCLYDYILRIIKFCLLLHFLLIWKCEIYLNRLCYVYWVRKTVNCTKLCVIPETKTK